MNLLNLFEDDNSTPSPNYAEELAYQIFKAAPGLDTTGAADEVLDYAFDLVVNDFGKKKAHALFAYDEDFDGDLVTAYLDLQMNSRAEEKKQVNEVDPRNFDSDEDYYAAQNAPAKRRSAPSDYPYSREEDDAYFNDIFRKKREAAKKAAQDKDQGVAEGYSDMMAKERRKRLADAEKKKQERLAAEKAKKDKKQQGVAEGDVVQFPKKHKGDLSDTHDCPKCGGDLQGGKYMGHEVKVCMPCKQVYLPPNSGIDQKGNPIKEADKKKEDDLEPQVKDVALQRAISRAKADFPTAGTGIEALAKDFMRSQDQDSKSFDQLRQAERKQDQMLGQISKIDQEQEQEIQDIENQNSTLASRLQQLQNVNGELEKKLAAMSGRKADKKSSADNVSVAPAPVTTKPTEPGTRKTKTKSKTKAQPAKSSMKSTAAQLAAPTADPMAAMSQRIQQGDASILNPKQQALQFEPSDNVLEPVIPQAQANPRFAAARRDASDVDPKYYADLTSKIARQAIADPEKAQQAYTVHEEEKEAKYSDKYQDMVARVGQKAREQEKSKPVDIKDLARRLAAIEASRKD